MFAWILKTKPENVGIRRLDTSVRRLVRRRRRREIEKLLEERLDAEVRERAPEEDGGEIAREQRRVVERVAGRVEEPDLLHELVVRVLAEELDQRGIIEIRALRQRHARAVVGAALEHVDALAPAVVHAGEHAVAIDGPRHRIAADAEVGLDVADELERILAGAIALVDEGEDRHAAALAHREQLARAILDAAAVVEEHHGAVGRHQRAIGVLGEVLVARRVEQIDAEADVVELEHARGDRDAALALQLHPVGRRVSLGAAGFDGAGEVNRAAVEEELFGEGGFAGVRVGDDREGAATLGLAGEEGVGLRGGGGGVGRGGGGHLDGIYHCPHGIESVA